MSKKSLLWSLAAAAVMLFASCNRDNDPAVNPDDEAAAATVKISIVSSARASSGTTPGSAAENEISSIEAYTFKTSGEAIDYILVSENPTSATLEAQEGAVVIAVVANSSIGAVENLTALEGKLSTHTFTYENSTTVPEGGFVMSATKQITLVEGLNTTSLSVKRTVSKFDAPNFSNVEWDFSNVEMEEIVEIFPAFNPTINNTTEITFAYESFAFANGLDKSLLLNEASYATATAWPAREGWIPDMIQYLNSDFDGNGFYNENGVYSNDFITEGPVYVHENFPYPDFKVGNITGFNPKEVYCFIIKGTLTWDGNTAERYWRINLVQSTTGSPSADNFRIFRNGYYQVSVDAVKTLGYGTPQEAEEANPVIPVPGETIITITVQTAPWDVYVSNGEM